LKFFQQFPKNESAAMDSPDEGLFRKGRFAFEDRRVFARFRAEFPLKYSFPDTDKENRADMRDLCAKGMCVFTNEQLAENSRLDLLLTMPDNGEEISTKGQVIWSERIEPRKYRVGIELEKPELMVIAIILRTLHGQARDNG
jgi:PilZ domain